MQEAKKNRALEAPCKTQGRSATVTRLMLHTQSEHMLCQTFIVHKINGLNSSRCRGLCDNPVDAGVVLRKRQISGVAGGEAHSRLAPQGGAVEVHAAGGSRSLSRSIMA
jgi:hypothetical protein